MNWYILAVIPVFGLLVFVHELGHFLAAKWAGIRVEEFGLGFPPNVVSMRKRDRGGWEVMWFGRSREIDISNTQNPFTGTSGGASSASEAPQHTIYSLNLLPIGGFVRMPGENGDAYNDNGQYDAGSFAAKSAGKRIIVLVAGVFMNFVLAMVLFSVAYTMGQPGGYVNKPVLGDVVPGSPAAAAGLHKGDTIVSVNGQAVQTFDDLRNVVNKFVSAHKSAGSTVPVHLEVRHDNSTQDVPIVVNARTNASPDEGALGVSPKTILVSYPLWQAPFRGIQETFSTLHAFLVVIGQMITGQTAIQLSGPVGVAKVTGDYAQMTTYAGWFPILSLTAFLSINIAIFNILPFPALDGGRVVLVLIEVLRGGKRLKPEREGMINFIGFALLLLLMVVVTVNDVLHWGS
ncbi:MAG TPA: M50 family metallopeptidase [Dictyobacter sp.]|jgi:regulator of sigma E protease|nr:M50 family metallopeptidase [Dictyobacter sp.]